MKKLILLTALLFPFLMSSAQKIEKSIIDDFTGNKVIYTSWEKIKSNNITGRNQLLARFRYENNLQYFELKWITGESLGNQSGRFSVADDAKLLLKLSNGEVVTLKSIEYSIAQKGLGTTGLSFSALYGMHLKYIGDDISKLSGKEYVTKVRIYTTDGYVDIELKEKDSKKINELYAIFITEIEKPIDASIPREKSSVNEDDF
jgi:hypothetical protein